MEFLSSVVFCMVTCLSVFGLSTFMLPGARLMELAGSREAVRAQQLLSTMVKLVVHHSVKFVPKLSL